MVVVLLGALAWAQSYWGGRAPGEDASPQTLDEVVSEVRAMEAAGRPRGDIAQWVAATMDNRITNMNSPERMGLGENWIPMGPQFWGIEDTADARFQKWRASNNYDYGDTARWAWDNRVGQCSEHASSAYYVLKEAGVDGNVRILTAPGHEFAVWGMADGADPNDPSTWGPDAWVVDGWMGYAVAPDEVQSSRYFKGGDDDKSIVESTTSFDSEAEAWVVDGGSSEIEDCFVATAAYGTPLAAEIRVLRQFRDGWLKGFGAGRTAVSWYEVVGPHGAAWLREHERARTLVREGFLDPLVREVRRARPWWDR